MRDYLTRLITEKGKDLDCGINLPGHIGLTYQMLVDFICDVPEYHYQIKSTLVKIDFQNGDVFHFLRHLAEGMVKSIGC